MKSVEEGSPIIAITAGIMSGDKVSEGRIRRLFVKTYN
jgi:hypothetical protein